MSLTIVQQMSRDLESRFRQREQLDDQLATAATARKNSTREQNRKGLETVANIAAESRRDATQRRGQDIQEQSSMRTDRTQNRGIDASLYSTDKQVETAGLDREARREQAKDQLGLGYDQLALDSERVDISREYNKAAIDNMKYEQAYKQAQTEAINLSNGLAEVENKVKIALAKEDYAQIGKLTALRRLGYEVAEGKLDVEKMQLDSAFVLPALSAISRSLNAGEIETAQLIQRGLMKDAEAREIDLLRYGITEHLVTGFDAGRVGAAVEMASVDQKFTNDLRIAQVNASGNATSVAIRMMQMEEQRDKNRAASLKNVKNSLTSSVATVYGLKAKNGQLIPLMMNDEGAPESLTTTTMALINTMTSAFSVAAPEALMNQGALTSAALSRFEKKDDVLWPTANLSDNPDFPNPDVEFEAFVDHIQSPEKYKDAAGNPLMLHWLQLISRFPQAKASLENLLNSGKKPSADALRTVYSIASIENFGQHMTKSLLHAYPQQDTTSLYLNMLGGQ